MNQKLFNFLSSFGLMILGVGLLFAFTVSLTPTQKECKYNFPKSSPRPATEGGDVAINFPASKPTVPLAQNKNDYTATMTAFSAFAIDEKTGTILFDKNSAEVRPLASITKLMSAIVLMDLPMKWTATTTVLDSDCDNSDHHLVSGEVFTVDEIFSAALIGSSNSAVRVLTRASGLTTDEFVARMNKKAAELDLKSLKYVDPTGLDAGNVGSAEDITRLLKEALRFEKIKKNLQTAEFYLHPEGSKKVRRVWSTDWLLLKWVPNDFSAKDICGKTGFINDSRYNFVVRLADDGGHGIVVSVLGAATSEGRFSEARDLAEWIYEKYLWPDEQGYDALVE